MIGAKHKETGLYQIHQQCILLDRGFTEWFYYFVIRASFQVDEAQVIAVF